MLPRFSVLSSGLVASIVAIGSLAAPAAFAQGTISDLVYDIVAKNELGSASFQAKFSDGVLNPTTGIFTWSMPSSVPLIDPDNGNIIAHFKGSTSIRTIPTGSFGYLVDIGYALDSVKTTLPTEFTITSAYLGFPTIAEPSGRATTALTVKDLESDGAASLGLWQGPGMFLSQYNQLVPTGTTFALLLGQVIAGPGGTATGEQVEPPIGFLKPLGEPAYGLSGQVRFSLTPNDSASGTSTFRIVPEPHAFALFALFGLTALRRR